MVGVLSCRESNASTANSGVGFSCPSYVNMCRDDGGGIDAFVRNATCALNYIIYPIFVQCYVMGRFGHENGPFWMLAGAVLVLFFLPLGPFWSGPFCGISDLRSGRFSVFRSARNTDDSGGLIASASQTALTCSSNFLP